MADVSFEDAKPARGYVRWTTPPDEQNGAAYKAEEGMHLVFGDVQPTTKDGAGRAGKRSRVVIQVWVVTRSNQDRAGDVRIALEKHLTLQDRLFDALDDIVPDGVATGQQNTVGITCHWIPGGDEIRRKIKVAPDTFVSVHLFEVKYVQPLRVNRADFS